ncbi:MAG: hypothetical protein ABIN91_00005, partial [Mucilaginibacter sp.]
MIKLLIKSNFVLIIVLGLCLSAQAQYKTDTIKPNGLWLDDRGKHVQAHGGGIIKLGDTYYWFGEDREKENDPEKRYVACYSSTDLTNWTFRNKVIQT